MRTRPCKKVCHKIGYPDKAAARTALKELRHIGVTRFYKCNFCRGGIYHLTSEKK